MVNMHHVVYYSIVYVRLGFVRFQDGISLTKSAKVVLLFTGRFSSDSGDVLFTGTSPTRHLRPAGEGGVPAI